MIDSKAQSCMIDNRARAVSEWLPHMQSSDFLRSAIGQSERTAECWAELATRNRRVAAGMAVIERLSA